MAIPHSLLEKRKLMYNGVFRYLQLDCRGKLSKGSIERFRVFFKPYEPLGVVIYFGSLSYYFSFSFFPLLFLLFHPIKLIRSAQGHLPFHLTGHPWKAYQALG
jgi:hypothetical protein